VWMHRKAAELMAARCEGCLRDLREMLGDVALAGTRVVTPDRLLDGDEELDLIGRRLRVMASEWSSAPGTIALHDESTATLIAGDSVLVDRVPDLRDGDLQGWQEWLERLRQTPCRTVVPGHGLVGPCSSIGDFGNYLAALDARISLLLASGVALSEVAGRSALPQYARWDSYAAMHARNAQLIYLRRERQVFEKN